MNFTIFFVFQNLLSKKYQNVTIKENVKSIIVDTITTYVLKVREIKIKGYSKDNYMGVRRFLEEKSRQLKEIRAHQ